MFPCELCNPTALLLDVICPPSVSEFQQKQPPRAMASDLFTHVQSLLSSQPPSTNAHDGWTSLIRQLESLEGPNNEESDNEQVPLPAEEPFPSLLDFYRPSEGAEIIPAARVDLHHSLPSTPTTPARAASTAANNLLRRLKRCGSSSEQAIHPRFPADVIFSHL